MVDINVSEKDLESLVEQVKSFDYSKRFALKKEDRLWTIYGKTEPNIQLYCAVSDCSDVFAMQAFKMAKGETDRITPIETVITRYHDHLNSLEEDVKVGRYAVPVVGILGGILSRHPIGMIAGAVIGLLGSEAYSAAQKEIKEDDFSNYLAEHNVYFGKQALDYISSRAEQQKGAKK